MLGLLSSTPWARRRESVSTTDDDVGLFFLWVYAIPCINFILHDACVSQTTVVCESVCFRSPVVCCIYFCLIESSVMVIIREHSILFCACLSVTRSLQQGAS